MKPVFLTTFALTAFAFNSILCRLALASGEIDAASFTSIRLLSAAATLLIIAAISGGFANLKNSISGGWVSAFFLFAYAVSFSFAYNGLTTATGALILFGFVQITMFVVSISKGERPGAFEWLGLVAAFGGLVYLVMPGLKSPPLISSALMAAAGIAWGFYTLRGKGSENPLNDTLGNFCRSLPFAVVIAFVFFLHAKFTWFGILMAMLSGALASGVGYAVWYAALKYHSAARASVLQLSVPLIAAVGGVIIVAESISNRLPVAAVLILGGILATVLVRK